MLYAADYNVLVYPYDEKVSSIVEDLFKTRSFDLAVFDSHEKRMEAIESKELGEALHKAYQQQSETAIANAKSKYDAERNSTSPGNDSFDVKVLDSSRYHFDLSAMLSGDELYLQYICETANADLILIPVVSMIQNFHHLVLYSYQYGDTGFVKQYENLALDTDSFDATVALDLASVFYDEGCSLVYLEGFLPGSTFQVDGTQTTVHDGYAVITEGQHELTLSCMGCEEKTVSLEIGSHETISMDASLKQITLGGLSISTSPMADVFVDGKTVGSTPLVLNDYHLPLTLTLKAEGYQTQTVSLKQRTEAISIDLKPSWLADSALQKDAKNEFYSDFARSLILFGAKIALGAFHDGTNKFFSSLDMIANGALTVSVIDLVGSLIGYYRHSVYVTP